jgi:hypothetical protein
MTKIRKLWENMYKKETAFTHKSSLINMYKFLTFKAETLKRGYNTRNTTSETPNFALKLTPKLSN